MQKNFIYSLLVLALPFLAKAQQTDENAIAGESAVFIYHAFPAASPAFPDAGGNTGFVLQRREKAPNAQWTTVRTFHSPQNSAELLENYQLAMKMFPGRNQRFDAGEAWGKWKKYREYDSLLNELSYAPGQLAFGVLVADTTVKANSIYQYRVLKQKDAATAALNDAASNWVSFPAKLNIPRPKLLKRRTERNSILLQWYITPGFLNGGFNVYRATGNDRQFKRLNTAAMMQQRNDSLIYVVQDTHVAFSEMYRYYIVPTNAFGGGGNIVSDTVSATCMDPQKLLVAQRIRTAEDTVKKGIALRYNVPEADYIGTVRIMRSTDYDTGYTEIGVNGPNDSLYTDLRIIPGIKYYYYLQMTDKMGRPTTRSIKTFGLFQEKTNKFPARNVKAERVAGGIRITWDTPPDTAALSGFYICRRQGTTGNFERITTLLPLQKANSYIDSSRNLRPSFLYAYSVVTENQSNIVSSNSQPAYISIQAAPADAPRLLTPRNFRAIAQGNAVRLLWYDMRLTDATLSTYNIYRKSGQDTEFRKIKENYSASLTSYADSAVVAGQTYTYALESVGGGKVSAQVLSNGVNLSAPVIKGPDVSIFTGKSGVTLTWADASENLVKQYGIYRHERGTEPQKISSVKAGTRRYEDRSASKGKIYYYYLLPEGDKGFTAEAGNRQFVVVR